MNSPKTTSSSPGHTPTQTTIKYLSGGCYGCNSTTGEVSPTEPGPDSPDDCCCCDPPYESPEPGESAVCTPSKYAKIRGMTSHLGESACTADCFGDPGMAARLELIESLEQEFDHLRFELEVVWNARDGHWQSSVKVTRTVFMCGRCEVFNAHSRDECQAHKDACDGSAPPVVLNPLDPVDLRHWAPPAQHMTARCEGVGVVNLAGVWYKNQRQRQLLHRLRLLHAN